MPTPIRNAKGELNDWLDMARHDIVMRDALRKIPCEASPLPRTSALDVLDGLLTVIEKLTPR